MIITHIFYVELIPNFLTRQINFKTYVTLWIFIIITNFSFFIELKKYFLAGNFFFIKCFKTLHILIRVDTFCFNSSKFLEPNSCTKYLKSSSDTFLSNLSLLQFINCILSMKAKFLPKNYSMYFSNPFGITLIFSSNLSSSQKINWLS